MAVIGKIRKRTGLLITIIAIAIMGFLVMDATNSQSGVIRQGSDVLGEVGSQKINSIQFEESIRAKEEERKAQKGNARAQLTEEERRAIREEAWNEFVENSVMKEIQDEIGLYVTPEEVEEMMVGSLPHPFVVSQFRNPNTGQFDPMFVRTFIENIDIPEQGLDPAVKRAQWNAFERAIIKDRETNKLFDIVLQGLYIPSWQKEIRQSETEPSVTIEFVHLPYTDITDEEVNVSTEDIKAYLKKNAKLYHQDEYRNIQFVSFEIKASKEDTAMLLRDLKTAKQEFVTTENDSIYLRLNSEQPFRSKYFKRDEISSPEVDSLFGMEAGTVVGPILETGMLKYAKLLAQRKIADSVFLRQIVFDFNTLQTQEQANRKRKLHDSVFMLIDSFNMDFALLVNAFSDDEPSKINAGEIGWLKFKDATEAQKRLYFYKSVKGSVKKEVLLEQNKLRIAEVMESNPVHDAIKVGYLSRIIIPSETTERSIYAEASKFASENRTADKFAASAAAQQLPVQEANNIDKNSSFIPLIGEARSIVRWTYDAERKVGEVSSVFSTQGRHVVALLTDIEKKGTKPLDQVETEIRFAVTKEKKAKMLSEKVSAAGSSLEEIANGLGKAISKVPNLKSTNAQLPGAGWETEVVYTALAMELDEVSKPIKGNSGVFVIHLKSKTGVNPEQANVYKQTIGQENDASVNQKLFDALKENANVQDNRSKFF